MRTAVIGLGLLAKCAMWNVPPDKAGEDPIVEMVPGSVEPCYDPSSPEFRQHETLTLAQAEAAALQRYRMEVCGRVGTLMDDFMDPAAKRVETEQKDGKICIEYRPSEHPVCPTFGSYEQ